MDCHALLQGIFPTQGSNPHLLHCKWILLLLSHQRSPRLESMGSQRVGHDGSNLARMHTQPISVINSLSCPGWPWQKRKSNLGPRGPSPCPPLISWTSLWGEHLGMMPGFGLILKVRSIHPTNTPPPHSLWGQ